MRPIPDDARAAIVTSFIAGGVERGRAQEATDLACHACEMAMAQLITVAGRAEDPGIKLMALEVGAQLLNTHSAHLFQSIQTICGEGTPSSKIEVVL